jgi:hypothetical protein
VSDKLPEHRIRAEGPDANDISCEMLWQTKKSLANPIARLFNPNHRYENPNVMIDHNTPNLFKQFFRPPDHDSGAGFIVFAINRGPGAGT